MPIVRITLPAEKRALREKMRALGLGHREIAAEFARRYRLRPRAAWREAHGWSLREAAAQINAYTGTVGLDPGGISSMTAPHLCEHENWPGPGPQPSGRRPSPYLLALLACVYGCTAADLIDLADREQLPPAELLILDSYGQEIPNLRNENRPSQLPHPSAQSAPQQTLSALPAITYRGKPEPGSKPHAGIEREVLMAAHEGSDHAEQAERRDIGDATFEQLRADLIRLSAGADDGGTVVRCSATCADFVAGSTRLWTVNSGLVIKRSCISCLAPCNCLDGRRGRATWVTRRQVRNCFGPDGRTPRPSITDR